MFLHKTDIFNYEVAAMNQNLMLSIEDIRPNLRAINLYQCARDFDSGARRLYDHYFLYVHKGKGRVVIGDKSYDSVSGDLYFCPPGTPNAIIADDSDPFLLSGIDFDFTQNHIDNRLLYPINAESFNPALVTECVLFNSFEGFPDRIELYGDEDVHELIYRMNLNFHTRKKYWEQYSGALLHEFIISVVRRLEQGGVGAGTTGKADKIIEYLSQNYTRDLTNDEMAGVFHYHPDYISKVVRSYTGMTLKQYVIDLRIRSALNALVYSDMSIKDIAAKAGYDNVHYFTRIFKLKTGYPPGYFRKRTLKQPKVKP